MTFTPLYTHPKSRRLILFFAGWSAEPHWFESLCFDDFDLIVVNDYTTEDIDSDIMRRIEEYNEIVVISWSFGVPAATKFIEENPELPVTLRMAVNGTIFPVDNEMGIPETIFEGTLNNLSEPVLRKFDRRMCGDSRTIKRDRGIESMKEELRCIRTNYSGLSYRQPSVWDIAVVGTRDNIIPTSNQVSAWEGLVPIELIDAPHYPDFRMIIGQRLINKGLMGRNFRRSASETYDQNAIAQARIARRLADIILRRKEMGELNPRLDCLEVGVGTGLLTKLYTPLLDNISGLTLCDISYISDTIPGEKIICDAETYVRSIPNHSLDLILGASVIQWFQSPGRFIEECQRVLRPGGALLLSTFSPTNFPELSEHTVHRLNTPCSDDWKELLNHYFPIYEVEEESLTVTFESPRHLLSHMKDTGVNSLSSDAAGSNRSARAILRSGLTHLTYHPIYLYARKRKKE